MTLNLLAHKRKDRIYKMFIIWLGRIDSSRLRRKWRMGDFPFLRRSRKRYSDWFATITQVFAPSFPSRVTRWGINCSWATRIWQCRTGKRQRPEKISTPGFRNTFDGGSGTHIQRRTQVLQNCCHLRSWNSKLLQKIGLPTWRPLHDEVVVINHISLCKNTWFLEIYSNLVCAQFYAQTFSSQSEP